MTDFQRKLFEKFVQLPWRGDITKEELSKHNKKEDCWCAFQGYVYDLTGYLDYHPGGVFSIMEYAGDDMTKGYMQWHRYIPPDIFEKLKIGKLIIDE
ncbi:hypothetical protein M9Y10_033316 [Tritrichomonas musculus]|mgnify:FL=1|uniref:Cytochrome b5 heme-binding domain-containing protein n=1 Tax=Tritrichomonas musculus TaxID=1915356 RepID=A0ABR2KBT9_9EUKA